MTDKPTKSYRHTPTYDYNTCRDYLQDKYGYDERDYAGKFTGQDTRCTAEAQRLGIDYAKWRKTPFASMVGVDAELLEFYTGMPAVPYQDFWHWVVDHYEIRNGCYITFSLTMLDEITEPWVKEIYQRYIDEFADESGEVPFYVWW